MNNQNTPRLKQRLAFLLLVSVLNFVASPALIATRAANTRPAPLNLFDTPTVFVRQIPLKTNDLVYSSVTGKLYASVPGSAGSSGNSIASIDPATGVVSSSTFIGSEPDQLTLSDDGHSLYVWLAGSFTIRRFDTLTNTPGLQFSMGQDQFNGRYTVKDFAVAPGNPNVLAVSQGFTNGFAPNVAIFDNGVRRANGAPSNGAGSIAFSASASKLYTSGFSFQTMTVDASGASVSSSSSLGANSVIQFGNGSIFTSSGQVINPDSNSLLGTFANTFTTSFVVDPSVGRAYYLTSGQNFGTFTLKAFDINTFLPVGSVNIDGVNGALSPLVRWGANGLAFRTDTQLFIIQTSLIPSAEPVPTPTPTPSPTPFPSPSPQAPTFVRTIALGTNDLIFNQANQKLYASVPSTEGSTGNSVAEIDPVLGSITNQTFVGSEPTQLGASDDGETLYVGLDGAASIRRYNMVAHTPGAQFILGRDTFDGPFGFSDIAVSPGNPFVIAVARQHRNSFPSEAGVAIYDNGVARANTGPGHIEGSDVIAFASPSILYGNNFRGLVTMAVGSSGVTVTGSSSFVTGGALILDNNRVYGSTGQVINPTTGELLGTFPGLTSDSLVAVDSAKGRAFFLSVSGTPQLKAFDINTFLPVGFVNLPSISGTPTSLLRWGSNGLAFRTNNRQVFLLETALVDPTVPVASPTPVPSPTPSPTPPYIPTFVRRVNLPANDLVYSEATQALYASVPSAAGANGNSITKITPETGVVGPSAFVGSEPSKMALSSDGQTLWVHLNGANAARRFDIPTLTPGLQFATSSQPPADMEVVPGSPQSLAISRGIGGGVAIFDNGVQRPNIGGGSFYAVGPIEFGSSPSILYGYDSFSSGFELVKFTVDASGLTTSTVANSLMTGFVNGFEFSNGLIYSTSGRVVDPDNLSWTGSFKNAGGSAMAVDAVNHRVFYVSGGGSNVVISAFDSNTFLPLGSITLPGITNTPVSLVRWGTNGLAFATTPSFFSNSEPSQVYLVQTELVSKAGTIPSGLQFEFDKYSVFEGNPSVSVKVIRTGDVSGTTSVHYATSDGTATAGSDYSPISGTLTFSPGDLSKIIPIPIINDNLFENGNETFTFTLSNPSNSAVLLTPATTTITISDDESKPSIFISSVPLHVFEDDSGITNLTMFVTLNHPTVQVVTVNYATSDGTATAGTDYVASSGTLTFPPGATSAPIVVTINGDTTVEPNETFNVNLSNATNVSFFQPSVTVVIDNNDASVQLSNTSFNVNESAGFATVTVTRVGDTSRAASVQYSTSDTAGLQACTVANGKASERCDYATSVGTVQFAIGEVTKTVIIPIVDDALAEGDETFTVKLSGPTGATLGATTTATITIVDNDSAPASQNPIDGVGFFVTQQYIDFLGRLPDSIGYSNWTATLGGCPNGGFGESDNPDCDRVHVSAGFFLSPEFQGRGYWAYKFYEVGLDRRPTYVEFVPDMAQVGGPQSPQSEAVSKAAYTDAFVQRPEFKNRYDALSNSDYANALETNAEVTLTNKAALVDALNTNQKTRAQVLREIVELQSVDDKFFVRAFVAMQYFGYLRRDPDTIGYNNWVTTLTANPSNFRHMIFGFIFSDEYRHRFAP